MSFFKSDGYKKTLYRPISFLNVRATPSVNINVSEKNWKGILYTNNIEKLSKLLPTWGYRTVINLNNETTYKLIQMYLEQTSTLVGGAVYGSDDFLVSPNDQVRFLSVTQWFKDGQILLGGDLGSDKGENKVAIELHYLNTQLNTYIRKWASSLNALFFSYSGKRKKDYIEFPKSFFNTHPLPLQLSRVADGTSWNLPLHPLNMRMVRDEMAIYVDALDMSGNTSAHSVNMKCVLAIACMLEYVSPDVDGGLIPYFNYDEKTFLNFIGPTDIHTLVNIFCDMCVYFYENLKYNELVAEDMMEYLGDWIRKNKMNGYLIQKFIETYTVCLEILNDMYPKFLKLNDPRDFPQNVLPMGFLQSADPRNLEIDLIPGESKRYETQGWYVANRFCEAYQEFGVTPSSRSLIFQPVVSENEELYISLRNKREYGNVYFFSNSLVSCYKRT